MSQSTNIHPHVTLTPHSQNTEHPVTQHIVIDQQIFIQHEDPGHSWLEVPMSIIDKLDITSEVSNCSYTKNNIAYLEEDCDLILFIEAYMNATGIEPILELQFTNTRSPIRGYARYG